jgi:hypothetical protein
MAMMAMKKPATAVPKIIETTRPEVVRLSCLIMQEVLPSTSVWQIRPGTQETMGVVVTVVVVTVLPAVTLFTVQVIDDREVVRQTRGPEELAIVVEEAEPSSDELVEAVVRAVVSAVVGLLAVVCEVDGEAGADVGL